MLIRHPGQAGMCRLTILKMNHSANALTLMHQLKCLVDVFQGHFVGNENIQWDFFSAFST